MGLSIRAYARHRGVTDTAVHKAIRTGRITPEADGTIDAERADRSGRATPRRQSGARASARRAWRCAKSTGTRPQGCQPAAPPAGPRCCRRAPSTRWSRRRPTRCAWPASRANWSTAPRPSPMCFKLARTERDAWLNWPARISAQMAAQARRRSPHPARRPGGGRARAPAGTGRTAPAGGLMRHRSTTAPRRSNAPGATG